MDKKDFEEILVHSRDFIRDGILDFEDKLKDIEDAVVGDNDTCPVKHSFSDGIYVREISIPKGTLLTGKIHKHDHPNFLMKGEVLVITESGGEELLKAPLSMISSPGTKRLLYAYTDLVWTTIHCNPTNTRDLEKIENNVIAKNYEEYDSFLLGKRSTVSKLKSLIIKKLSE